jgi:hypothetical protein
MNRFSLFRCCKLRFPGINNRSVSTELKTDKFGVGFVGSVSRFPRSNRGENREEQIDAGNGEVQIVAENGEVQIDRENSEVQIDRSELRRCRMLQCPPAPLELTGAGVLLVTSTTADSPGQASRSPPRCRRAALASQLLLAPPPIRLAQRATAVGVDCRFAGRWSPLPWPEA